jgi:hypothetical protein
VWEGAPSCWLAYWLVVVLSFACRPDVEGSDLEVADIHAWLAAGESVWVSWLVERTMIWVPARLVDGHLDGRRCRPRLVGGDRTRHHQEVRRRSGGVEIDYVAQVGRKPWEVVGVAGSKATRSLSVCLDGS